jgi:hypothetical protein
MRVVWLAAEPVNGSWPDKGFSKASKGKGNAGAKARRDLSDSLLAL